jgi:hypothetical protein
MLTNPLPPNNGGFNLPSPPSLKRQGLESILNKSIFTFGNREPQEA